MKRQPLGDAALAYAGAAALVHPLHTPTPSGCSCHRRDCRNVGKHPRTLRGLDDATSDVAAVERWWKMWPDANVGVRLPVGVIVVDVDPRHNGATSLVRLQAEHGQLPRTQTARTGGGGLHLWFGHDGLTRGSIGPGLDIKNSNGYVVMPPSLHESGNRYEWINEEDGIQPAPPWLIELLTPAALPLSLTTGSASPARAQALLREVRKAEPGERNRRLYWACCKAVGVGLDLAPLVAAAVEIGLTQREAEATAKSAAKQRAVA